MRFIYDGMNVIEEYSYADETWTLEAKYVYGIGIDNGETASRLDEDLVFVRSGIENARDYHDGATTSPASSNPTPPAMTTAPTCMATW